MGLLDVRYHGYKPRTFYRMGSDTNIDGFFVPDVTSSVGRFYRMGKGESVGRFYRMGT